MGMQNPIIAGLLQFAGGAATSYKKERDDAKAAETKIRTMGIDEQNKRETMSHEALLREKESKRIAASPTGQANERRAVAGASLAEKRNEGYESPLAKTVRETKDAVAKALEAEKTAKKTAQLKEKRAEDIQSAKDTFRGLVGSYAKGQSNGKALIKWASSPQGKLLDGTPFWNRAGLDEIATGVLPPQDQDLVDQVEAAEAADNALNPDPNMFRFDGKGNDAGATAKPEGIGQGEAPPSVPAPVVAGAPEDTSSVDESDIEGALMPPPASTGGRRGAAALTEERSAADSLAGNAPATGIGSDVPPDNSATVPADPSLAVTPPPSQNAPTPPPVVPTPEPQVVAGAMGDDSLDVGPDAELDLGGVEEPPAPMTPPMGLDADPAVETDAPIFGDVFKDKKKAVRMERIVKEYAKYGTDGTKGGMQPAWIEKANKEVSDGREYMDGPHGVRVVNKDKRAKLTKSLDKNAMHSMKMAIRGVPNGGTLNDNELKQMWKALPTGVRNYFRHEIVYRMAGERPADGEEADVVRKYNPERHADNKRQEQNRLENEQYKKDAPKRQKQADAWDYFDAYHKTDLAGAKEELLAAGVTQAMIDDEIQYRKDEAAEEGIGKD